MNTHLEETLLELLSGPPTATGVCGVPVLTPEQIRLAAAAMKARPILQGVALSPALHAKLKGACDLVPPCVSGLITTPNIPTIIDPRLPEMAGQPYFDREEWLKRVAEQAAWDAEEEKPWMLLDPTLPLTHKVPIHPETGEVWSERHNELVIAATDARYESDPDLRKEAQAEYNRLAGGLEFRDDPYVCQYTFCLGSAYRGMASPAKTFGCHPDVFAKLPEETQRKYRVKRDESYRRGQTIKFPK